MLDKEISIPIISVAAHQNVGKTYWTLFRAPMDCPDIGLYIGKDNVLLIQMRGKGSQKEARLEEGDHLVSTSRGIRVRRFSCDKIACRSGRRFGGLTDRSVTRSHFGHDDRWERLEGQCLGGGRHSDVDPAGSNQLR